MHIRICFIPKILYPPMRNSFLLLAFNLFILASCSRTVVTELQKVFSSDGAKGISFGSVVSVADSLAIIGANNESAFIFGMDSSGTWTEITKLTASDGTLSDRFGNSASISGRRVIIGASADDDDVIGTDTGSAYIFEADSSGTWLEMAKLTASDAGGGDFFGQSVSISGDRAIVGAFLDDGISSGINRGSAYIFEIDSSGFWSEVAKLTPLDEIGNQNFGSSVCISGELVIVGAYLDNLEDGSGIHSGSVYIFERNSTGTWSEVTRLRASDEASEDYFGGNVFLNDNLAVVGARLNDDDGSASGSAYIFKRDSSGFWSEATKLTASDASSGDLFGASVSLWGNRVLIGAPLDDGRKGSAYIFELDSTGSWTETAKLLASDGTESDRFGGSVSIFGNNILIGSSFDDDLGRATGSAYFFR